jgi:GPN-loop GTPase
MIAEFVCGPAGCGKTTYCEARRQFLEVSNEHRIAININLDPANEGVFPYICDVDVREIASHRAVAASEELGPNGSYMFCADLLAARVDQLIFKIGEAVALKSTEGKTPYLVIDAPGQVEFYLQSDFVHRILHAIEKNLGFSVCLVHLHDAMVATRSIDTYVSACLLVLTFMVNFELPQLNFLSKWDCVGDDALDYISVGDVLENFSLLAKPGIVTRNLEFAKSLLTVVEGYSIVGFRPLAVEDARSMASANDLINAALGFL